LDQAATADWKVQFYTTECEPAATSSPAQICHDTVPAAKGSASSPPEFLAQPVGNVPPQLLQPIDMQVIEDQLLQATEAASRA
jgi:hypothetical protein